MKFRKDINGLRALAVVAVVLFHFDANLLSGGFAGVDVFFVISGFLMTSIIVTGIEKNNFSVIGFYRARGKRIIPALAVLCFSLLIFSWFLLPPIDYQLLAKHSLSSLTFLSNMVFWQEAGYFDAASHEKWLLHTWSLSVEWQFYIIYPLAILTCVKLLGHKSLRWIILIGTLLGLALSAYASVKWPSLAFYSLPTRAWEMMLGGLAFLFPWQLSSQNKRIVELLGITLILISYFTLTGNDVWPGYMALIPTLGTYLVIVAATEQSLITGNVVAQWLGKVSYSLYLWHWPVVVAIGYFAFDSAFTIWFGITLCLVLASLSFYFVEKNTFKAGQGLSKKIIHVIIYRGTFALSCALAVVIFVEQGVYSRKQDQSLYYHALEAQSDWNYPAANYNVELTKIRRIPSNSNEKTLFLGDSLIEQYYPRMHELVTNEPSLNETWFLTHGGCFPIKAIISFKRDCKNINDVVRVLESVPFDKIVIGGDWWQRFQIDEWHVNIDNELVTLNTPRGKEVAFNLIDDLFSALTVNSKQVFVVLPLPTGKLYDYKYVVRQAFIDTPYANSYDKQYFTSKYASFTEKISRLAKKHDIKVINPLDYLCGAQLCNTADVNGSPIYKDTKHIRASYMREHVHFLDHMVF
jgi:peptidoglycan/LPS O-acetylase OafA/YrhL